MAALVVMAPAPVPMVIPHHIDFRNSSGGTGAGRGNSRPGHVRHRSGRRRTSTREQSDAQNAGDQST